MQKRLLMATLLNSLLIAEDSSNLDDIVVSATEVSQQIEDTVASAQVITREEILPEGI